MTASLVVIIVICIVVIAMLSELLYANMRRKKLEAEFAKESAKKAWNRRAVNDGTRSNTIGSTGCN